MAINYKGCGTWLGKKHTWRRKIRGAYAWVSCRQLGLPETQWTKEQSYQAAKAYFRALATQQSIEPEAEGQLKMIDLQKNWARQNDPQLIQKLEELEHSVRSSHHATEGWTSLDGEATQQRVAAAKLLGIEVPSDLDPSALANFFGDSRIWADRLKRTQPIALEFQFESIATAVKKKAIADNAAKKTIIDICYNTNKVFAIVPKSMDVRAVDSAFIAATFQSFSTQIKNDTTRFNAWSFFLRMVRFAYNQELLDQLPRNIKDFAIRKPDKIIEPHKPQEIITAIESLSGRLRLYLLLALNCGMDNVDIALISRSQFDRNRQQNLAWIDWDRKTLTRRRRKTNRTKAAPSICYRLWDSTSELLVQCQNPDHELVLTSKNGTVLVDGAKDLIGAQWRRSKNRPPLTLDDCRSACSSLIKSNAKYTGFENVYLANVPSGVAEKHYAQTPQNIVDEMIIWLGEQFNQTTT
jgi:integrase